MQRQEQNMWWFPGAVRGYGTDLPQPDQVVDLSKLTACHQRLPAATRHPADHRSRAELSVRQSRLVALSLRSERITAHRPPYARYEKSYGEPHCLQQWCVSVIIIIRIRVPEISEVRRTHFECGGGHVLRHQLPDVAACTGRRRTHFPQHAHACTPTVHRVSENHVQKWAHGDGGVSAGWAGAAAAGAAAGAAAALSAHRVLNVLVPSS
jgi:hypothetical protein